MGDHPDYTGLPPELWLKVLTHLRRPIPTPNAVKTRVSIQQGDLATVMRVSTLFNKLAAPLLYTHVVTDSLYDLLANHDEPRAHPAIESKGALLSRIKTLYIEYPDPMRDPTYAEIFDDDCAHVGGPTTTIMTELGKRYTPGLEDKLNRTEFKVHRPMYPSFTFLVVRLWQVKEMFEKRVTQGKPIFSTLERVCLGAVFGGYASLWRDDIPAITHEVVLNGATKAILLLLHRIISSELKHYCERTNIGPYSLDTGSGVDFCRGAGSHRLTVTGHIPYWACAPFSPTRVVCVEEPPALDVNGTHYHVRKRKESAAFNPIELLTPLMLSARVADYTGRIPPVGKPYDLELYFKSRVTALTAGESDDMDAMLCGVFLSSSSNPHVRRLYKITGMPAKTAPICLGCGVGPEMTSTPV